MFERFTRGARSVVIRAQHEARDLGQSPIGTQHLLLALAGGEGSPVAAALAAQGVTDRSVRAEVVRRAGSTAGTPPTDPQASEAEDAAALRAIGIDLDAVRRAIEANFGAGALNLPRKVDSRQPGPLRRLFGAGHTPFSPRAKKVLELSLREALRLKHNYIAEEHIMLGLVREGNGLGAQILAGAGVDVDRLRDDVTRSLQTTS